jgi:hypothetical protein
MLLTARILTNVFFEEAGSMVQGAEGRGQRAQWMGLAYPVYR